MLSAGWSVTHQTVFASTVTLEIHLVLVNCLNQLNKKYCHHVHHHLVVLTRFAKNKMVLALVLVFQNILVILMKDVDQSVPLTLTVQVTKLASTRNVKILVPELVDPTLIVK